ncbi:hypothetical protein DL546_009789 [Coniochaeta pulveracea]|uniref:Uncharacterized protein n=1 Tax=Coniochaeta pulveracea TaxID=177199 RepID=A0A420YPE2_9PEZI|nr:hypothetical protein DL546_009789 [Coniochaeta pulveracea]
MADQIPPTAAASVLQTNGPFPSFEELVDAGESLRISPDARLRWALNEPFPQAISVMPELLVDPDTTVFEPYYQENDNPGVKEPSWHPISQSPLTVSKISSVTIRVDPLDDWNHYYMETHRQHAEPDVQYDPAQVLFGPLPDPQDEYERASGDKNLLRCCGQNRPRGKGTNHLVIRPRSGNYLTIHDFVSTVHPYLLSRRDDILAALGNKMGREHPDPPDTKLMVVWCGREPNALTVDNEKEWLGIFGKRKKRIKAERNPELEENFQRYYASICS